MVGSLKSFSNEKDTRLASQFVRKRYRQYLRYRIASLLAFAASTDWGYFEAMMDICRKAFESLPLPKKRRPLPLELHRSYLIILQ